MEFEMEQVLGAQIKVVGCGGAGNNAVNRMVEYGLRGVDSAGRDLGTLKDVLQPGGNDVYVFEGPLGEVLVPALKSVVLRVDLEKGEMLLDAKRLSEVAVFDED